MNQEEHSAGSASVPHLEIKAALLLVLFAVLVVGTALFLMYARGSFESTQQLVLVAEDSEGVSVGMDLTFSGFPIGRVRRIELAPDASQSEEKLLLLLFLGCMRHFNLILYSRRGYTPSQRMSSYSASRVP